MFFAAGQEFRDQKRRSSRGQLGGVTVDADMEITLEAAATSNAPIRRSIDSVYPGFAKMTMKEIVEIADPDYVSEFEPPPPKKSRKPVESPISQILETPASSPKPLSSQTSYAMRPKCTTLEELIVNFPELRSIIEEQETRARDVRIPLEYVRQCDRPKAVDLKPSLPAPEELKPTSMFSNLPSVDTSAQPSVVESKTVTPPSEPEANGGGLLAGIDDLFGDSKKSKLKSRKR